MLVIDLCVLFLTKASWIAGVHLQDKNGQAVRDRGLFGYSILSIGDFDGDGTPEFMIGDPLCSESGRSEGRVWIYSGKGHTATIALQGTAPDDSAGGWLASVGDLDGDGTPEICAHRRSGYLDIYSPGKRALLFSLPVARVSPSQIHRLAAAGAGDIDHDGRNDLVVSYPGASDAHDCADCQTFASYSGRSGSCLGKRALLLGEGEAVDRIVAVGELRDEGHPEFLASISSPAVSTPRVVLLSTKDVKISRECTMPVEVKGPVLSLAAMGDLNHDGVPEIAIGVRRKTMARSDTRAANQSGHRDVLVYSGKNLEVLMDLHAPLTAADPEQSPDEGRFGEAVVGTPDVTGDGVGDILVSMPDCDQFSGAVLVFSGADGSLWRLLRGEAEDAHCGQAMCAVGDLDGDGVSDVVVGICSPQSVEYVGRVRAYSVAKKLKALFELERPHK